MSEPKKNSLRGLYIVSLLFFLLTGCDAIQQKLGLENTAAKQQQAEEDAKAVGGACRQSGRALEDCYSIYSWLNKAFIYEGWREMDTYMRENQLEIIEPQLPPITQPPPPKPVDLKKKIQSLKPAQ